MKPELSGQAASQPVLSVPLRGESEGPLAQVPEAQRGTTSCTPHGGGEEDGGDKAEHPAGWTNPSAASLPPRLLSASLPTVENVG